MGVNSLSDIIVFSDATEYNKELELFVVVGNEFVVYVIGCILVLKI